MNESQSGASQIPGWWRHPGEVLDKKGAPIYPGDLIRTPHFIGARRKQYYLYHTAVYEKGYMELVPTAHLQPSEVNGGGRCALLQKYADDAKVISGCGPRPHLDYKDRPKIKRGAA